MTDTLVVGWLDAGTVTGPTTHSLVQLAAYEIAKRRLVTVIRIQSGPHLEEGRNRLVESFLRTDAEWLLMVDADMVFDHDAAEKLLAHADPDSRPVVGGLCFGINETVGVFPTLFGRNGDGLPVLLFPEEGPLVRVDGTGTAFLVVHRSVFGAVDRGSHPRWFTRRDVGGPLLGEDLSFCWDAGEAGVPIHVALDVKIGHVKSTVVFEDASDVPTPWL